MVQSMLTYISKDGSKLAVILLSFAFLLCSQIVYSSQGGDLVSGKEVTLTKEDLLKVYAALKDELGEFNVDDKKAVLKFVGDLYVTKVLAHNAIEKGLLEKESVKARLWLEEQKALSALEIERYVGQRIENIDFDLIMRERFAVAGEDRRTPKLINSAHILYSKDNKEGRQGLENLAEKIRQGEISFDAAAREFSQDEATSDKGGELGWRRTNELVLPFREVLEELPVGVVSDVVETRFGFHIIKVNGIQPSRELSLEEFTTQFGPGVLKELREQIKREYLDSARLNDSIVYDIDEIQEYLRQLLRGSGVD